MRWKIRCAIADYNGQLARTSVQIENNDSVAAVKAAALSFYDVVSAISTGYVHSGEITSKLFTRANVAPSLSSDFDRRLLVLFRQDNMASSFIVPSYNMADLESVGGRAGYLVAQGSNTAAVLLPQLRDTLLGCFDNAGRPYTGGNIIAAVMKNPIQ